MKQDPAQVGRVKVMLVMTNSRLESAHAKGLFWGVEQESVDDPLHRSREHERAKHHHPITPTPPSKAEAPNHQRHRTDHQDAGRTGREIGRRNISPRS